MLLVKSAVIGTRLLLLIVFNSAYVW